MASRFQQTQKKGRRALPYNTYVQHHRQEEHYEKRKTHQRYQRLQKFEARQQTEDTAAGGSRFMSLLAKGQETEAEEYERKLQLSFGGSESAEKLEAPKKKSKKRKLEANDIPSANPELGATIEGAPVARSRAKTSKTKSERGAIETEKPTNEKQSDQDGPDAPVSNASKSRKLTKKEKKTMPDRYTKELREYEAQQEAWRLEREQKDEEEKQRNRRRKESAKGRAITGALLSQRTSWGQPRMQSMLEMVTSKLQGELGASAAPHLRLARARQQQVTSVNSKARRG